MIDSFLIGIFLGYSILQLLEYGVAAIITPIKRFYDYLRSGIAGLEQDRQVETRHNNDFQAEGVNTAHDNPQIRLEQEVMTKNWDHLDEEIKIIKLAMIEQNKAIKREMAEIKERMDSYAIPSKYHQQIPSKQKKCC